MTLAAVPTHATLANATTAVAAATASSLGNISSAGVRVAAVALHAAVPVPASDPLVAPRGFEAQRLPSIEDAVLLMAIAANCVLILAPLRSALLAARSELAWKELAGHLAPTYMLFGQSYFWACYGFFTGQPDISHFNTFGAGMCVVYLAFICRGARTRDQIQVYVSGAVAVAIFVSLAIACAPMSAASKASILGLVATVFSMLQSAAPMLQALEVLQTMSLNGFPMAVASSSCVSSILWAQYAVMVHDYLYFIPNAINALVGVSELAIVAWVLHRTSWNKGLSFFRADADHRPLMPRTLGTKAGRMGATHSAWPSWPGLRLDEGCNVAAFPSYTGGDGGLQTIREEVVGSMSPSRSLKQAAAPTAGRDGEGMLCSEEPEFEPEWGEVDKADSPVPVVGSAPLRVCIV